MMRTFRQPTTAVRRVGVSVAFLLAFSAGAASSRWAYDPNLDTADLALEKAEELLMASSAGVVDSQTQRTFDRHIRKALSSIASARDAVDSAIAAVVSAP